MNVQESSSFSVQLKRYLVIIARDGVSDTLLKKTPAQVFSSDLCKIFQNTILMELHRVSASKCNSYGTI